MRLFKTVFFSILCIIAIINVSACSNNKNASTNNRTLQNSQKQGGWQYNKNITNIQKIEQGTIISMNTIAIKPEKINTYGSVGVSVGSGGQSGVYGAFDLATLGKVFRNATKPKTALRFIIKKANGEMVAITQPPSKEVFKIGDSVKLLLENDKAKVIH